MLVHTVERAAKSRQVRACQRCGHMIQPGERYHYLDHWRAPRSFWCSDHRPRPSDMVTSPNKRRLYLAQEGLIDASTTSIENIIPALHLAVIEASAVANHYAEWDLEKHEHVEGWIDELRRLLDALNAGDIVDPGSAVLSAAQRATIFDNWSSRSARGLISRLVLS